MILTSGKVFQSAAAMEVRWHITDLLDPGIKWCFHVAGFTFLAQNLMLNWQTQPPQQGDLI